MSWLGILALIQSLVNQATIGPIVFFICLMMNEETLNFMPARHYPAYIIGLFPSVYDWVTNVSNLGPLCKSVQMSVASEMRQNPQPPELTKLPPCRIQQPTLPKHTTPIHLEPMGGLVSFLGIRVPFLFRCFG